MVRISIVLFRNGMTLEKQHRWWLEEHAPIAREMPGLRRYSIHLSARGENGQEPEIAGIDDLYFDDWNSAMAAWNSAEWKAAREHTEKSGARTIRTWMKESHEMLEH